MGTQSENLYHKYPYNYYGFKQKEPMLKLTLQQRLDAYVWAYKNFMKVNTGPYLCNVLISYIMGDFRFTHMNFPNGNILHMFPELKIPKDENGKCEWWHLPDGEDNIKRMEALRDAVIRTKHLIDNEDILG